MISKLLSLASIFLVVTNLVAFGTSQSSCFNNGNYTRNSTFNINLNSLFSSLPTNVDDSGFYNASMGRNLDTVYASVLCRGDVQLITCRSCIQNAATDIVKSCPNHKQAVQFNEFCTLRYSDKSMFGIKETGGGWYWWNQQNASNPVQFMGDVRRLLYNLRDQAASAGSLRKLAAGNSTIDSQSTVFSLVQCTPDLSPEDCSSCLNGAISEIPMYCDKKIGCRVLKPSCILRYEAYPFYNDTRLQEIQALAIPLVQPPPPPPSLPPSSPPPGPPLPPGKKDDSKTRTIIIVVVSVVVCLIAALCASILLMKRTKMIKPKENMNVTVHDINEAEYLQYDFCGIKDATDNFSEANKLGQGGFGAVYKGKLLNGQEIAVKRLSMDSGQGDVEFKNEVLLVAKLQHRNLVRLLGFSIEGNERILVYEFVKNGSLDRFIFDPIKRKYLDWEIRYKIIGGISRGLLYLHEESRLKIIHRDLKASNILIDDNMNPKIADFGMARLCAADETQGNTSRIVGTYGYMSREYAMHGQFSIKSDVYSLGVLILEIIAGQKSNSFQNGEDTENLLSVAWKCWRQGTIEDLVDPVLKASLGFLHDMLRCIYIGLLCVQENPTDRPTMTSVILMLTSFTISLPVPSEPISFGTRDYRSKNRFFQAPDSKQFESTKSSSQNESPHSIESSKNDISISESYLR